VNGIGSIDADAADVRDQRDLGCAVEQRIEQRVARLLHDVFDQAVITLDECGR
jgi:hypothetical protein